MLKPLNDVYPGASPRTLCALLAILCGIGAAHSLPAQSPHTHGTSTQTTTQAAQPASGKYYALVIGINEYHSPLPKLKTAAADAKSIASVLQDDYGFKVRLLIDADATRVHILDALNDYRDTLTDKDNLLIYYAGHGYSDHEADKAYWLPVDADSVASSNRIIADELTTSVRVQPARHVLIISDSCYSGGLSRDADAPGPGDGQQPYLQRMLEGRSRTLMASGGDEPVSDDGASGHSVFAYAVLQGLENGTMSTFTASELFYGDVRQQVAGHSEQLPNYSIIRNSSHDSGDFVFTRLPIAAGSGAAKPIASGAPIPAPAPTVGSDSAPSIDTTGHPDASDILSNAAFSMNFGKKGIRLRTGSFQQTDRRKSVGTELSDPVTPDTLTGHPAVTFGATLYCRQTLLYGQIGECDRGLIFISETQVVFRTEKGKEEFSAPRSETTIRSEGGREGDTFSLYNKEGARYRFGRQAFDSPFMTFMRQALTDFPAAQKSLDDLLASQ